MADPADTSGAGESDPTQDGTQLAIDTRLGKDALLLTSLAGKETISRGFSYQIEFLTRVTDADVRELLGTPVTLWLDHNSPSTRRPLHGHVRRLIRMQADVRGYRTWRADVVPWTWFLSCTTDCRVFQNLSIPDVVRAVCDEYGFRDYRMPLHAEYPKLDYCVQYRETAYDFVSRLLEHVGIFTWFEFHPDRHVLVLADNNLVAPTTAPATVRLAERGDMGEVQELQHEFNFHPGVWALADYDFDIPSKNLRTREPTRVPINQQKRFEIYDYPGGYTKREDGARLTRLRMEQQEVAHHVLKGSGTCVSFNAGRRIKLAPEPGDGRSAEVDFLLTEVEHYATAAYFFSDDKNVVAYGNRFNAAAAEHPFRPERVTRRPVVHGPQTATVTGPAGESIHTDRYGRVKVLFHWDRHGNRDDTSSCWVRVSQHSAGSHWGALSIPHVGQEVVIGFLEGDPDRPIVIGRVHNGATMPPVNLPADKHKTIIRDHGDNRLILHGKPGHERLSVVSPKNLNFVAMRSPAKPLSAQTIDGVGFDDFQDGASLQELKNVFDQLAQQKAPAGLPVTQEDNNPAGNVYSSPTFTLPNTPPPTGQTVAEGADLATNVDINTLSENDINSLSVGSTNGWVHGNLNSWVNGEAHTWIGKSSFSEFAGPLVYNFVHFVQNDLVTTHLEETGVHVETVGVHAEVTAAHFEDTVLHMEETTRHYEKTTGSHFETSLGPHYTMHSPDDASYVWTPSLKRFVKDDDSIKASWQVTSNLISFKAQPEPLQSKDAAGFAAQLAVADAVASQLEGIAAMPPAVPGTSDLLVASLVTPEPPVAPGQFELECVTGNIQSKMQLNIDGGLMISLKAEVGVQVNGKMIQLG